MSGRRLGLELLCDTFDLLFLKVAVKLSYCLFEIYGIERMTLC